MAATYVIHEGQTGAVANYPVPFDYLSTTHVNVEVNDVPTAFTFISTYMISILPNPIGKVKIFRNTPDEAITTFTDGSVLLGDDLNSAFIQSIYISQEAKDAAYDEMAAAIAEMEVIRDEAVEETGDIRDAAVDARNVATQKAAAAVVSASEALASQNAAFASAGEADNSEAAALASQNAAHVSEVNAQNSAAASAQSLAQAEALIQGLEDGPVISVNGRWGNVTGIAEQADNYTKTVMDTKLALKADKSDTYTKAQVDAAVSSALQTGDILYTLRNPGSNYLQLNGSTYLQSAYPALIAAIGNVVPTWAGQKIANPTQLPANAGNDVAWSPNGRYLAVAHGSTPFITVYDWQTGAPVKIANPAQLPSSAGLKVAWSPSGRYMAVLHATAPALTIYDWNTGVPVKIANPAVQPTLSGNGGLAWSPDSRYLAVAHDGGSYLSIYDLQSGTPVRIANPGSMPPANAVSAGWSPNGRYLVIGHYSAPYVLVYDWVSGSPVKMGDVFGLTAIVWSASWSPNGRYLTLGLTNGFVIFDWNTGSPVKLEDAAQPAAGGVYGVSWSPDGRYMATAHLQGDYISVYDMNSGAPVKLGSIAALPGNGNGAAWRPGLRYLALAHGTTPFVTILDGYYALGYDPNTEFKLITSANGWIRK